MKPLSPRNLGLALVGLVALTLYVLACTSFSPDDTKVLYPAFDRASGAIGVAVYDRESRRSELAFIPAVLEAGASNTLTPLLLRSQWLPDGRHVVIAWPEGKNNNQDGLSLAVIPWGSRAPIKLFFVPNVKDAALPLMAPLCLSGDRLLLIQTSNVAVRIELKTGALAHLQLTEAKGDISLYPAPGDQGAFYVEDKSEAKNHPVFGRINPETFALTPMMSITNTIMDGSFFAYDATGKHLALVERTEGGARLVLLREGRTIFARPLSQEGQKLVFGSALFSPKGDAVRASFQRRAEGQKVAAYGLMEIPLSEAPIKEATLIAAARSEDDTDALLFQVAISHDGKTAALASTYLAVENEGLKPEDCALFFMDLAQPKWVVTKVPIPLPTAHPAPVLR